LQAATPRTLRHKKIGRLVRGQRNLHGIAARPLLCMEGVRTASILGRIIAAIESGRV